MDGEVSIEYETGGRSLSPNIPEYRDDFLMFDSGTFHSPGPGQELDISESNITGISP